MLICYTRLCTHASGRYSGKQSDIRLKHDIHPNTVARSSISFFPIDFLFIYPIFVSFLSLLVFSMQTFAHRCLHTHSVYIIHVTPFVLFWFLSIYLYISIQQLPWVLDLVLLHSERLAVARLPGWNDAMHRRLRAVMTIARRDHVTHRSESHMHRIRIFMFVADFVQCWNGFFRWSHSSITVFRIYSYSKI